VTITSRGPPVIDVEVVGGIGDKKSFVKLYLRIVIDL